jgi:conjugative relaxase-like TrwC/TraI family protein
MGARIGTNSKIGIGGRSIDYYVEELAENQHEYYTGRGEAPGEWAGSLAEALGLSGQLTAEQFKSVMEGVHPITGEPLEPFVNLKNQGLDIRFDLPESFSAFYALADERGRTVMHQAVREAMDRYAIPYLEDYACIARLGAQGNDRVPGTGFLVSMFTHRQSREGDPHLHVHAIFANAVHTDDGRGAAPDLHMLYAHHKAAGALFEAGVRHVLSRELGFKFEERNGQLEIAGIPAELCHLWSIRRAQIQAQADAWAPTAPAPAKPPPTPPAKPRKTSSMSAACTPAGVTRRPSGTVAVGDGGARSATSTPSPMTSLSVRTPRGG